MALYRSAEAGFPENLAAADIKGAEVMASLNPGLDFLAG